MSPPFPMLRTNVGRADWGECQFFGHPVGGELVGEETYCGMIGIAIRGRRLPAEQIGLLDDLAVIYTQADPRIWPLKLVRVVCSYGGALGGVAAINLVMEDARLGPWTCGPAAQMLVELYEEVGGRIDDAPRLERTLVGQLERKGRLLGFGVPFRDEDERAVMLRSSVARRGRAALPYWRTLETIIPMMRRLQQLEPNIGVGTAAVCLDMGFTPHEISWLAVSLCQVPFIANAVEGAAQKPDVLRRLPDEAIRYIGAAPRVSPCETARRRCPTSA